MLADMSKVYTKKAVISSSKYKGLLNGYIIRSKIKFPYKLGDFLSKFKMNFIFWDPGKLHALHEQKYTHINFI